MVKTTINLDTEVYRALVDEAIKKYGTTKTLSRLINEKLREKVPHKENIVERTKGTWKIRDTGLDYTRKIRQEWERRPRV